MSHTLAWAVRLFGTRPRRDQRSQFKLRERAKRITGNYISKGPSKNALLKKKEENDCVLKAQEQKSSKGEWSGSVVIQSWKKESHKGMKGGIQDRKTMRLIREEYLRKGICKLQRKCLSFIQWKCSTVQVKTEVVSVKTLTLNSVPLIFLHFFYSLTLWTAVKLHSGDPGYWDPSLSRAIPSKQTTPSLNQWETDNAKFPFYNRWLRFRFISFNVKFGALMLALQPNKDNTTSSTKLFCNILCWKRSEDNPFVVDCSDTFGKNQWCSSEIKNPFPMSTITHPHKDMTLSKVYKRMNELKTAELQGGDDLLVSI